MDGRVAIPPPGTALVVRHVRVCCVRGHSGGERQRQRQRRRRPDDGGKHGHTHARTPSQHTPPHHATQEELDEKLMVQLRDGRKIMGVLRSFDQVRVCDRE